MFLNHERDLTLAINKFIDAAISSHQMNRDAHNEFLALALLNADIQTLFNEFEEEIVSSLFKIIKNLRQQQMNCYLKKSESVMGLLKIYAIVIFLPK